MDPELPGVIFKIFINPRNTGTDQYTGDQDVLRSPGALHVNPLLIGLWGDLEDSMLGARISGVSQRMVNSLHWGLGTASVQQPDWKGFAVLTTLLMYSC